MKHYGIEQWVDFTRGLSDLNEHQEMTAHLGSGVRTAAGSRSSRRSYMPRAAAWQRIRFRIGSSPGRLHFPGPGACGCETGIRLPVELIFDSLLVPVPAGLAPHGRLAGRDCIARAIAR